VPGLSGRPSAARLREVIAVHLSADPGALHPQTRLSEDLGVDSLALLDLGMTLEDTFDVGLPDMVLGEVRTVGDLVRAVQERAAPAQVRDAPAATARSKSP
jgi:acyl carrier protein